MFFLKIPDNDNNNNTLTKVITNCDNELLQIATGITNCDNRYYKLRQVLQIATTAITN